MSVSNKAIIDLSIDEKTEFFTLYKDYQSADKQDDRAKKSWLFLCFVYKHLGNTMLTYFIDKMFDGEDAKATIATMIRVRSFIQPHL
jgi:hypothetical protein